MAGKVDAHGFGSDLVITDGFEGTAIGGVDEQQNDGDADAGEEEGHHGLQMQGRAAQRKVEAGKAGKAVQKVGTVGQRAKALVNHGGTDDLGKAQCSNGKIVALELQHRQADEEGEQRCDKTGQDQAEHNTQQQAEAAQRFGEQFRDGEADAAVCIALIDGLLRSGGNGEDGVGVGTQQHKTCLTQTEQAGKAVQQVHGDCHQCIDGTFAQHGEQHGGHKAQVIQCQQHHLCGRGLGQNIIKLAQSKSFLLS